MKHLERFSRPVLIFQRRNFWHKRAIPTSQFTAGNQAPLNGAFFEGDPSNKWSVLFSAKRWRQKSSPFHRFSTMQLMESYSLALQFRAAQEAVKGEMPARVWATRLVLFCDVMSALLVIQLGQFSHPAPGRCITFKIQIPGYFLERNLQWRYKDAILRHIWEDYVMTSRCHP